MNPFGVLTLIQARHGSSRLPGKALRKIGKRPMLAHVIERAKAIGFPVVVATSINKRDDAIAKFAKKLGVDVYRGDEADVLGRMSSAATNARIVIRITGDCPLLCPNVAKQVWEMYVQGGDVIATNDTSRSGWPDGLDVEVFQGAALHEAAAAAIDPEDREHVTKWIRRHRPHVILPGPTDAPSIKLSVDTEADYERVCSVYERIPEGRLDWEATFAAVAALQKPDLPPKAIAALRREGITPADAAKLPDEDLLSIKGIGAVAVERLRGAR